ncbi:efflux RND transporter periplasmic adaptor subunit [Qiania dongpingensis]|uniref:Efflux RND transporter periplasmic adaptor subunit n=1 Tax=Qiania dongpingensis TaxID=2763669 RepID=A0A7G9G1F1_9FIRM|nr:efflux RND transporter periplasmic adaptor subunit [Qiania dongpingensis]QNM04633.1 efflux RND transporter periplasmic adaptor subunit [Qiania dongpingensis]
MKKKVIIGIGVVLLAVIAGLVIWRVTASNKPGGDDEAALYADSVGMLTGTGLGTQNRFAGVIEAQNTLKIRLESEQTVKEIFVEKGQSVEVGTPLFQYDTEDMGMKLEQAQLELEKISNGIDTLNAQIETLTKEKKNAPSSEQLSFTTQIQELQTNVKQEEYNYKVKELEMGRLQKSIESAVVNSTIAGIVQEINENPTYDSYTGEQQAFMSILAVGKYRVKGSISEQNMRNFYVGMPVIVHSRVDDSLIWSGTVDTIDTEKPITGSGDGMAVSSGSDTGAQATKYPFYVTLDSSDGLMLGQHVYLEPNLGQGEEKDGMWLMSSYIVRDDGDPYVWAAGSDGKLEKRPVSLGDHDEEMDTYQILDGLKASDYIVWPSEDCKKGAAVYKNDGTMPQGNSGGDMEFLPGGEENGVIGGMDGEAGGAMNNVPEGDDSADGSPSQEMEETP